MELPDDLHEQLRQVFDVCDEGRTGTISASFLLNFAGEHFGTSSNSVEEAVSRLGCDDDGINFHQFCLVVATILQTKQQGEVSEVDSSAESCEDVGDGQCTSKITSRSRKRSYQRPPPPALRSFSKRGGSVPEDSEGEGGMKMPRDERGSPSSLSELDSAIGGSTTSPESTRKANSGCSSMSDREEENFECYGEAEDIECDPDTTRIGDVIDGSHLLSPPHSLPPSNFSRRNSWVRRSLRCSPSSTLEKPVSPRRWGSFRHTNKRVGGTAVASQLYRTSSFSSGRSSAPDHEDMYSDASLEDDVLDLNHKVQMLQQQVDVLADNQVNSDDRFSRIKQDNGALQARVVMLEEQLRDVEMRAAERLDDEQRRNKELISRIEREKTLTVENYSMKQASIEKEKISLENEYLRTKKQFENIQKEKGELEERVSDAEYTATTLTQANKKITDEVNREKDQMKMERERSSQVIEELRCEVERLRAVEEASKKRAPSVEPQNTQSPELQALQANLKQVKEENKNLLEQIEDLQAQLLTSHLEEGRNLVSATNNNSLAAEFEAMTNEEGTLYGRDVVEKLKNSLKESQEANLHLRSYIDGILLNIVENYPQLLEVKQKH